jgi:hypothetical protein
MTDARKRRAILEKKRRMHYERIFTLCVIGTVLASAVIAMNMDKAFLASKNNTVVYVPEKMFTDADNSLFIMTTDGDGTPLPNKHVVVEIEDEEGTRKLYEGSTDETGTAAPAFPLESDSKDATLIVTAGSERVKRVIQIDSTARIYLSTDKPIYQPGQIIHIRTLTFEGQRALASTRDVKIEVQAPDGTKIYGKTLTPNEFGIANLDYPLATILPLGIYKIFASVGVETVQKSIIVNRYVLPKFNVDFDGIKSWYTYDERITATLNCTYFFGEPIEGHFTLDAKSYLGVWETVHTVSGTLSGGKYSFEVPPVEYSVGIPLNSNNGYLELNVTITDTGGHTEQKSKMLSISKQPIVLTLLTESNIESVESTYYAVVNYPDGAPIEGASVEYSIEGLTDTVLTDERGIAELTFVYRNQRSLHITASTDGYSTTLDHRLLPSRDIKVVPNKGYYEVFERADFTVHYTGDSFTKWVYYEVISKGVVLSTGRFQLDGGIGHFEITMDADMSPFARVRVYKAQKSLEVASDTVIIGVGTLKGLDVEISTDKEVYRPHEDAYVSFEVSSEGAPVTSALGVSMVDMSVFEISERFQGFEEVFMNLEDDFTRPEYQIKYYVFSDDTSYIPADGPREVNISIEEPNMVSSWPLRLEQAAQLESNTIGNFFSVLGGLSILGYFALVAIAVGQTGKRRIIGPSTSIAPAIGVVVAVAVTVVLASVMYIMVIGLSPTTSNAPGGATTWGSSDSTEQLSTWPTWGGDVRFFFESEPELPDSDDPGTDTPGGIAEPARVRTFFPETWYWNPTLITDENGKASITLTTPDSITSWGLEASASTKDAKFGIAGENITVFQEFFVEPDIPLSVIQNDIFPLKVMIYNYISEPNNVTVRLFNDTWFELQDSNVKQILVEPNSVTSVSFRIKASEIGVHEVSILAGNARISDAVVREMRVDPKGQLIEYVISYRLDDNDTSTEHITLDPTGIPGTEVAYVKLQPGIESVLIDGAEKYIIFVSGCGEQSTSRLSVDVAAFKHLMETGITDEQMAKYEQILTQGIQHELIYLVTDMRSFGRAISWFGGPPDLWLTAWATFAFKDLEDVGFEIDERLLPDFHKYLVYEQSGDGSYIFPNINHWSINSKLMGERTAATAYITRALLYSGYPSDSKAIRKAVSYIESHVNVERDDPFTLALALIALEDGGGSNSLKSEIVGRLLELKVDDDEKSSHWDPLTIEATAYASIALHKSGEKVTAFKGITYLLANRHNGRWGSTHDTAVSFQAVSEVTKPTANDIVVTIIADGVIAETIHITEENSQYNHYIDISLFMDDFSAQVRVETNGSGMVLYQIYYSQYVPWFPTPPPQQELFLEVTYDATTIQVDDYLVAHLRMMYNGPMAAARMILVDLRSPVGFSFVREDIDALVDDGTISLYETAPRQLKLYLENVPKGEMIEFDYRLFANLPIKGTIQGVNAFDMYDSSITTTLEPVVVESI